MKIYVLNRKLEYTLDDFESVPLFPMGNIYPVSNVKQPTLPSECEHLYESKIEQG